MVTMPRLPFLAALVAFNLATLDLSSAEAPGAPVPLTEAEVLRVQRALVGAANSGKAADLEKAMAAASNGDSAALEAWIKAASQPPPPPRPDQVFTDPKIQELVAAAGKGDAAEVERMLKAGVDLNSDGGSKHTPLSFQILTGNRQGAELLLQKGANPNVKVPGIPYESLMAGAAGNSDRYWLGLLLKYGGDPNVETSNQRQTPLFFAINSAELENVRLLLGNGARVDVRDAGEKTPLLHAVSRNRYDAAMVLLNAGADWRVSQRLAGMTVEMYLLQSATNRDKTGWEVRAKFIDLLVEKGAQLDPQILASRALPARTKATIGDRVQIEYHDTQWESRALTQPAGRSMALVNAGEGFTFRILIGSAGSRDMNLPETRRAFFQQITGAPAKVEDIRPFEIAGKAGYELNDKLKVGDEEHYFRGVLVAERGEIIVLIATSKGTLPMSHPSIVALWDSIVFAR